MFLLFSIFGFIFDVVAWLTKTAFVRRKRRNKLEGMRTEIDEVNYIHNDKEMNDEGEVKLPIRNLEFANI